MLRISFSYAADFTFVSMADSRGDVNGINKPVLDKLVGFARNANPAFVLFSGDIVTGSKDMNVFDAEVNAFANALKPLTDICMIYNTFGNHESLSLLHQEHLVNKLGNPVTSSGISSLNTKLTLVFAAVNLFIIRS